MKIKIYLNLIVLLILTSACQKESILADGKDFNLDYGFSVSLNDDRFQIHFDELLEDSRCPPFALCQWEGRVKVKLVTIENGIEKEFEFSSLAPIHMDTIFNSDLGNFKFEINSIDPPFSSFLTIPANYNLDFTLTEI